MFSWSVLRVPAYGLAIALLLGFVALAERSAAPSFFEPGQALDPANQGAKFPSPEKLSYRIEWRLVTAGSVTVDLSSTTANYWETSLHLESAGLVTRLYRVLDTYKAKSNGKFCPVDAFLDAQEGKRHTLTHLVFEQGAHKVNYEERDLVKNATVNKQLDIPPCTYDITGALAVLRQMSIEPGRSITVPITDGKKVVQGRIEAQTRERISVEGKTYQAIRYEAFLFDNVLYKRKGRLLFWITDDADHLPVQFRLQLGFPIGTVTVLLEKEQKL